MEERYYEVIGLYRLCGDYGLDHGRRGGACSIFGCNKFSDRFGGGLAFAVAKGGLNQNRKQALLNFAKEPFIGAGWVCLLVA